MTSLSLLTDRTVHLSMRPQKSPVLILHTNGPIQIAEEWCDGHLELIGKMIKNAAIFRIRRLGPSIYRSPQKNIRNFKHPKNIFEIFATPKNIPILYLDLEKDPKMRRNDPQASPILWWPSKNIHNFEPPKIARAYVCVKISEYPLGLQGEEQILNYKAAVMSAYFKAIQSDLWNKNEMTRSLGYFRTGNGFLLSITTDTCKIFELRQVISTNVAFWHV